MKKRIIFILCLFLTLSVGKMMATPSTTPEVNSTVISYSVNLGDITGLSEESMDVMINEAFAVISSSSEMQEVTCTATIKGKMKVRVGIGAAAVDVEFEVEVTVSGPCSEIISKAKEAAKELAK